MSHDNAKPQIPSTVVTALVWLVMGWVFLSMQVVTVLESTSLAGSFISEVWWQRLVSLLGGQVQRQEQGVAFAVMPFGTVAVTVALLLSVCVGGSAILVRACRHTSIKQGLPDAAHHTGMWACVAGSWSLLWIALSASGLTRLPALMGASIDLWCAVAAAGWISGVVGRCIGPAAYAKEGQAVNNTTVNGTRWRTSLLPVTAAIALYTCVYTTMNWQMYRGLLIPHGDSAMYEEHLWNLLHGKGFRSYLDQGLFLGEHIQFIHLALIPVYVLWPSHLLLELSESFALAITALPVYWITRRHTQSDRAALWMAVATLLYFPLHYLDIAIDFKTFRPISFGVPLLLFAIDQMERGRLATMGLLFVATLTAKEDFAIVLAPLGLWLAISTWRQAETTPDRRRTLIVGTVTAVLATIYLLLAVKVFIPWFRSGDTVHYARYFSRFGETPTEIVTNMITQPGLLLGELLTTGTILYFLRIVVPLGGTPLLSPTRLLVGGPLFLLLCLNEIAQSTPAPVHHFHAPLIPIVLWSAAAGLPNARRLMSWMRTDAMSAARLACCCALFTGACLSFHPMSLQFWDPGRLTYWRRLYIPGERATQFAKIESLIPLDARVASTDFVHPRYTHHARSYDYSKYPRKVANYEDKVPDDTDYIVIDTQHPYSEIKTPDQVRELRQHPDDWELLPDETNGYFIVLKRRTGSRE
ncbi:MAG: DUF2079 domain-containing protein [Planctomycetaceae bacterium]